MQSASSRASLALLAALLVACGREPRQPPPYRPSVILFVPKVQGSLVIDTTGSVDAERLTMVVPVSSDSVAAFYHASLEPLGWRILSDRADRSTGIRDLYASRGPAGATLWVHIEHQDSTSSRYTLIATGARAERVGDSTRR